MLDHPITVTVVSGIILAVILAAARWLFRTVIRPEIRISTEIEKGPTTHELGFTEPAVKVTLSNTSNNDIQVKDIRLMFCKEFGASIALEAPPGRFHLELPASLAAGAEETWYIPAEQLSHFLRSVLRPPRSAGTLPNEVKLYASCVTGSNKIYKGPSFSFSTDQNSHSL